MNMEFAVEMSCGKCEEKVRGCLSSLEGVKGFQVSLEKQSVVVETNQPSTIVLDCIRATGLRAVAAVAMLGGETGCGLLGPVKGVVRFLQMEQDRCLIDGTIDGLEPGHHGLHIHELGDLSGGCDTFEDKLVKVGDIIGRSVAVNQGPDDPASRGGDEQRIACGIIARSAGMFENSKRICACDGVELWDEKDRPLTGPSRRNTGHL
uniref:Superoxide dismutase copper chaperone n=1 Tax=Timema tahoe TaxID=61484 RepID=A0A7R9FNB9_9NEOP|nr:unnamed protein product [Timema tahoe]